MQSVKQDVNQIQSLGEKWQSKENKCLRLTKLINILVLETILKFQILYTNLQSCTLSQKCNGSI